MIFNNIYNVDCLEGMRQIESESFDLTITSPPYNLGNNHHTGNKKTQSYDDNMAEEEYQIWQLNVLNELFRVTRKDGSVFYNHKNRIKDGRQITPYSWILKSDFIIKQELVWFNGSQNFDKIRFYPMTERIFWLAKSPKTKLFNSINHHDFFSSSDWKAVGTRGSHTRAFPEKMVKDIISCFPECKAIFDPFSGSGTVCAVAKKLGIDFIGFEKDPFHYEKSIERVFLGDQ